MDIMFLFYREVESHLFCSCQADAMALTLGRRAPLVNGCHSTDLVAFCLVGSYPVTSSWQIAWHMSMFEMNNNEPVGA